MFLLPLVWPPGVPFKFADLWQLFLNTTFLPLGAP